MSSLILAMVFRYSSLLKLASREANLSKEEYLNTIAKIKEDIKNGAYYELNYCIHFSASICNELDIYSLFMEVNERTQSPFAAFVKINNSFLLCFSPD